MDNDEPIPSLADILGELDREEASSATQVPMARQEMHVTSSESTLSEDAKAKVIDANSTVGGDLFARDRTCWAGLTRDDTTETPADSDEAIPSLEDLLSALDCEEAHEQSKGDDQAFVEQARSPKLGIAETARTQWDTQVPVQETPHKVMEVFPITPATLPIDSEWRAQQRRIAEAEAEAFKQRQNRLADEAKAQQALAQRRAVEAAVEARERRCMAAEEAEERARRAAKIAAKLEEDTRKRLAKAASRRREAEESAREHVRQAAEARRAARRSEREARRREREARNQRRRAEWISRMAENHTFDPLSRRWVKLEWADGKTPSDITSDEEDEEASISSAEHDAGSHEFAGDDDDNLATAEPVEQPPLLVARDEVLPLDDVLEELDRQEKQAWEEVCHYEPPPLAHMLQVLDADQHREEAGSEAAAVRQQFEELAQGSEARPGSEGEAVDALPLRLAKQRCPQQDWDETIVSESALQPWNDFVEEKQEDNSFEERQARQAAILAKLHAARNRLSVERWKPRGTRT